MTVVPKQKMLLAEPVKISTAFALGSEIEPAAATSRLTAVTPPKFA
jgi:hypothetical protein